MLPRTVVSPSGEWVIVVDGSIGVYRQVAGEWSFEGELGPGPGPVSYSDDGERILYWSQNRLREVVLDSLQLIQNFTLDHDGEDVTEQVMVRALAVNWRGPFLHIASQIAGRLFLHSFEREGDHLWALRERFPGSRQIPEPVVRHLGDHRFTMVGNEFHIQRWNARSYLWREVYRPAGELHHLDLIPGRGKRIYLVATYSIDPAAWVLEGDPAAEEGQIMIMELDEGSWSCISNPTWSGDEPISWSRMLEELTELEGPGRIELSPETLAVWPLSTGWVIDHPDGLRSA